jgi:hypothetical protein
MEQLVATNWRLPKPNIRAHFDREVDTEVDIFAAISRPYSAEFTKVQPEARDLK